MFKRSIHTTQRALQTAASKRSTVGKSFGSAGDVFQEAAQLERQSQAQQQRTTIDDRFIPNFNKKTTYDPFDFSISSQRYQNKVNKTQQAQRMKSSSFNSVEINPSDFYVLPHLLSSYVNVSGQILHRSVTGLSGKKQKQMAKAIRRARAFGLMSSVAKDVSTFAKRGRTL